MCIIVIVAVKNAMLFTSRSDPLVVVVGLGRLVLIAVVKLNAEEGKKNWGIPNNQYFKTTPGCTCEFP